MRSHGTVRSAPRSPIWTSVPRRRSAVRPCATPGPLPEHSTTTAGGARAAPAGAGGARAAPPGAGAGAGVRIGEQLLDLLGDRHVVSAAQPPCDERTGRVGVAHHTLDRPAGEQAV